MKLVLFSDLHLDSPFVGLGRDVANRRRQALRDTLSNIAMLTRAEGADALLCAGDLYEQSYFTEDTARFVRSVFGELNVPVFIAPGNHDWYGRISMYQRTDLPSNVHVFSTDSLSPIELYDGVTLWGAAHCAPAGTLGFFDRGFQARGSGIHLALFHGSERGWLQAQGVGKDPHAPFDERQIAEAKLHHAFVGHYHKPKEGLHHTYAGNPCPLTFGEDAGRGAVVALIDSDGAVHREWRQISAYEVHELRIDVTGSASQQDIRDRILGSLNGLHGCARVNLIGDLDPQVQIGEISAESIRRELDAIVIRQDGVRVTYQLEKLALEKTVRGQFVRDVMEADLNDDQRRRILITGLRAMDGRTDLEVA